MQTSQKLLHSDSSRALMLRLKIQWRQGSFAMFIFSDTVRCFWGPEKLLLATAIPGGKLHIYVTWWGKISLDTQDSEVHIFVAFKSWFICVHLQELLRKDFSSDIVTNIVLMNEVKSLRNSSISKHTYINCWILCVWSSPWALYHVIPEHIWTALFLHISAELFPKDFSALIKLAAVSTYIKTAMCDPINNFC